MGFLPDINQRAGESSPYKSKFLDTQKIDKMTRVRDRADEVVKKSARDTVHSERLRPDGARSVPLRVRDDIEEHDSEQRFMTIDFSQVRGARPSFFTVKGTPPWWELLTCSLDLRCAVLRTVTHPGLRRTAASAESGRGLRTKVTIW